MRVSAILTIGAFGLGVALASEAKAEPAHVTCVGDSITFGVGTVNPAIDAYPAQLQKLLGAGYAVENDGHSGATMLVSGDLPYPSVAEYTASTAWAAAGGDVIIQLGTNDTKPWNLAKKASFQADCESLVAHYRAATGKPRVWVSLPPPVFDPSCCGIASATMRDEIIPRLKQCAAATGVPTIDVFGALAGQAAHFPDGVHPDNVAARIIAQTVHAALTKAPSTAPPAVSAPSAPAAPIPTPSPSPAPPPTSPARGSGCALSPEPLSSVTGYALATLLAIVTMRRPRAIRSARARRLPKAPPREAR